jgi:hypothetical protein
MEYSQELLTLIQSLELQRVAELKKFGAIAFIVLIINLIFFMKFRSNFLISLGLGFFVLVGSYYAINSTYKDKVQTLLLPKMINSIDPDFKYEKKSSITKETINSWKLFSHEIDELYNSGTVSSDGISFSFIALESSNTDTEEGRHESRRFDGVIVYKDLKNAVDQSYLISAKKVATTEFEAGDFINASHMGLKKVKDLSDTRVLYSQSGTSTLDDDMIKKIELFTQGIKRENFVVFKATNLYILVDGINENYSISLIHSLESQGIIQGYVGLIKEVQKLL